MKVISVLLLLALVVLCSAQAPPQAATDAQNQNDFKTLQYALTLEHLEAAFYRQGLNIFSDSDFQAAGLAASVRPYVGLIAAHERSHVDLLTAVLEQNGVSAVRECTYNFTAAFSSVRNFLTTAQLLEVTGTRAYDGAANTINNAVYLEVAATIATVEARHSAYLNELNNETPFPTSFEETLTPQQVLEAAAGFFVSCPDGAIQIPVVAYTFVPLDNSTTYFNRSGQLQNSAQIANDDDLLNYALTLELFGGAFYERAENISRQEFADAGFDAVYDYFQMIIDHERAHVEFLQSVLATRGVDAAQPCTYNFGTALDSVENVLNFARILENLEVTAYDGAINTITDYQLIQGAATIATVEARHAQYLNNVLLGIAVNNESLDTANNPNAILNITAPFFGADCARPNVPVQAFTLQALNQPAPTTSSTSSSSATSSASFSSSNSPTSCPSATSTATNSQSASASASMTPSASSSPARSTVPSITSAPTIPSDSATTSSSLSSTSTPSLSSTSTASVSSTSTASVSATSTTSLSSTSTASVSSTSTASASASASMTPSASSSRSTVPSITSAPTIPSDSQTASSSFSSTSTASFSSTPAPSVSSTPSLSSSSAPSLSNTAAPSMSMSPSAVPTPSSSPVPSPSGCPTPTPSCPPKPCGCNSDSDVVINFYFADMLRGQ